MRVAKKTARPRNPHPVFTIRFTEGLATRHRLPLDHVIRVLTEVREMLRAVGKQVQREQGEENPSGDFGLEIVGGFQKGSVKASLAITKNEAAGVIAARQVLNTVTSLTTPSPRAGRKAREIQKAAALLVGPADPRLVSRLGNISKVQEIDKTRVEMALVTKNKKPEKAVFDRRTTQVLTKLREPNFAMEDITIYGKLSQLRDKQSDDDDAKRAFFGELVGDDGNVWRIEFKPADEARASALFRKQVWVTGNVFHYKALNAKVVAKDFGLDEERDYEAAFDEMYGASPELTGIDLATLIRELETD